MIFKKISVLVLLVLCRTNTSESRRCCRCHDKTKFDTTEELYEYNSDLDNIGGQQEQKTKELFDENMKLNASDSSRGAYESNTLTQYYPPHITSGGNIQLNPITYPTNNIGPKIPLGTSYLNVDPYPTEALLKQVLSHQLGNVDIPQSHNPYFNTGTQIKTVPHHSSDYNEDQDSDSDPYSDENRKTTTHYNYIENGNHKDMVMPLGASLGELKYKFPDYGNSYKQQTNILKPKVIPAHYGGHKQQGKVPTSPQVSELGNQLNGYSYIYKIPYKYDPNIIPNTEHGNKNYDLNNIVDKHHNVAHSPLYADLGFNVPNKEFGYNTYDIVQNGNKREHFSNKQAHRNDDNNIPLKYNSNNMVHEQRYHAPATHIAPNRLSSTQHEPGKFSKWVMEQIELLKSKNQGADNVDLSGLGYSIQQILSENGMYITNNGMLIDTYGTVSNIHTLSLTPIVVGSTMSLRNLQEGKYGALSSKSQMPYLNAILVSASHPLKILGIIPLGTTYLPRSTLIGVLKNLKSAKSAEDKVVEEEPIQEEPEKEIKEIVTKVKKSSSDHYDEKYKFSNGVNINSNNNRYGISRLLKIIPNRQGQSSKEVTNTNDDHPYSKPFKLNVEVLESNGGKLLTPHTEFQDQPIDILTRQQNIPVAFVSSKYYEPARIHIPSISSILDFAHKSKNTPINNDKSTQNDAAEDSNELAAISDVIRKLSDPTTTLQQLNLLKKNIPVSVGGQIVPTRRSQIVGDEKPTFKLKKPRFQTVDYGNESAKSVSRYISPVEQLDIASSAVEPDQPIIPAEFYDGNNSLDMEENYDDDGDFRIIGGNAATGSGTPLSNKGRSGYVF